MKKWHGVNILWARHMFDIMNEVGDMVDMHRQVNTLQFGTPGPIGNMIQNSLRLALQSFRSFFETHNNLPSADYDRVINDIVEETKKYHSYFNYYCCWGRNPLYETTYHCQERRGDEPSKRCSVTSNNNIILDFGINTNDMPSPPLRRQSENETKSTQANEIPTSSPDTLPIYPSPDQHPLHILSLGEENVSDIDQFAEGYED